ncbi:hypothetical protein [Chitinophaga sp.]|uniref:hypothetical protein n=1 Tax=Chitinophaga sp. TaxID=1869181 RepID=UPI0031CF4D9C
MKNAYPEKLMVPYQRTKVEMGKVVAYLKNADIPVEVKRSTYIVFRNESANGKSGVNNNFGGIQVDSTRWPAKYDHLITGVVSKAENGTGKGRLFAAFASPESFLEMLADRLKDRGIFVGGNTYRVVKAHVDTPEELALIYKREWVTGNEDAIPTETEQNNFLSMYSQAAKLFT